MERELGDGFEIDPTDPYGIAELFVGDTQGSLRYHRALFYEWTGSFYAPKSRDDMRARMFKFVRERCIERGKPGQPIKATSRFIDNVYDATKAIAKLEDCIEAPAWMKPVHAVAAPGDIIPMQNGLFDHRTRTLHQPSEHLFNYARCRSPTIRARRRRSNG